MEPLNRRRLKEYIQQHSEAEIQLRAWWNAVQSAKWQSFAEVRRTFSTASYVDPYTVFNIKGNDYRLVTYIDFTIGIVVMKCFGTHAEYDKGQWR